MVNNGYLVVRTSNETVIPEAGNQIRARDDLVSLPILVQNPIFHHLLEKTTLTH